MHGILALMKEDYSLWACVLRMLRLCGRKWIPCKMSFMVMFALVHQGEKVFVFRDKQTARFQALGKELYMVFGTLCRHVERTRTFAGMPMQSRHSFPELMEHFLGIQAAWKQSDNPRVQKVMEHVLYEMHVKQMMVETETVSLAGQYQRLFGSEAFERLMYKLPGRVQDIQLFLRTHTGAYSNEQIAHEIILDPDFKIPREPVHDEVSASKQKYFSILYHMIYLFMTGS